MRRKEDEQTPVIAIDGAAAQLCQAAGARKCWACGCLHGSLAAIEAAFPAGDGRPALADALRAARERLVPVRYDCLGCDVCYPALAVNTLTAAGLQVHEQVCATEVAGERAGWPPLPGAYTVLRFHAPVAVCTLTDDALTMALAQSSPEVIAIVGTMQTENLGIERLILNVLANPHIRFLVIAGADSRRAIGHLPGHSLLAVARSGIDDASRIIGAGGKRPVLRNVPRDAVEYFRRTVEVVDQIGCADVGTVVEAARACANRSPGPAEPYAVQRSVRTVPGSLLDRMVPDPAGYFVIYVDRRRAALALEHFRNDGVLDVVVEGRTAAELYTPAIDNGLVSRLDHAAYLGRELARAEQALRTGDPFVQDSAPERPQPEASACGCGESTRASGSKN